MTSAERPGVRYALTLGAADVGARVMVRRRLPDGLYGDVLGQLESWTDEVTVRDRHGVIHAIPVSDVVAGKRIPPAPERR